MGGTAQPLSKKMLGAIHIFRYCWKIPQPFSTLAFEGFGFGPYYPSIASIYSTTSVAATHGEDRFIIRYHSHNGPTHRVMELPT